MDEFYFTREKCTSHITLPDRDRLSHKLKVPVSERKKPSADVRSQRSHLQMIDDALIELISNSEAETSPTPTPTSVDKTSCL